MSNGAPYSESSLSSTLRNLESVVTSGRDLMLREEAGVGFLSLRGDFTDSGFTDGIKGILGTALPRVPTHYRETDRIRVFGISPDEWLVAMPEGEVARAEIELRRQLTGHYAIVDVSGGYTLVSLSGGAAERVLNKSCVYDFHRRNFPVGRAVQTVFAATSALISRTDDESFDVVIRRSFADHIARWIVDAGSECGISVEIPACTDKGVP